MAKLSRRAFLSAALGTILGTSITALSGCKTQPTTEKTNTTDNGTTHTTYHAPPIAVQNVDGSKVTMGEDEWKAVLSKEQYRVLREKGTERAFTGQYNDFKGEGVYHCVACGNPLFSSESKFDSGSGWPSYWEPLLEESVHIERDSSLGMIRSEVLCNRCSSHLGHVFNDGPQPTGLRYCINSVSLHFEPTT